MTILAIDTSMAACSAAILPKGSDAPVQLFEAMGQGHAEALFPMIEAVMGEARRGFGDLRLIAVTRGPGSFTGVRAGIAAARGLAIAARLPVVGVTSLEVMARACLRLLPPEALASGFAVMHDARRGDLYAQVFSADGSPMGEPELIQADESCVWLPPSIETVAGSGAALAAEASNRRERRLKPCLPGLLPEAADLALLAAGKTPDARPPSPLYLRAPDAKPQTEHILARASD
jgi:tRNA threonylcarbamoyl adenosine modification protein YeaZ